MILQLKNTPSRFLDFVPELIFELKTDGRNDLEWYNNK